MIVKTLFPVHEGFPGLTDIEAVSCMVGGDRNRPIECPLCSIDPVAQQG